MKILGVVVLYYPDEAVATNAKSYIDLIDGLVVWDNTPVPTVSFDFGYPNKVVYKGEGENKGIGYALNQAIAYARTEGYTHLLTMDQDSYFERGVFNKYLERIKEFGEDKRVIFSTNYYLTSQKKTYYPANSNAEEVSSCMTSGSIYPLALFNEIGDFNEELFVWGVDCEFSWRAKRQGIATICFKNILLTHNLGYQRKRRKLLGKEIFPNEYSPTRSYYNVRNGILLQKEYPECINLGGHLKYHLYKRIVFILLYEQEKFSKLKALYCGYRHGKKGKYGMCTQSF